MKVKHEMTKEELAKAVGDYLYNLGICTLDEEGSGLVTDFEDGCEITNFGYTYIYVREID